MPTLTQKTRSPHGVMQAMLSVIPDEEIREQVRQATKSTLDSAKYTAPEAMAHIWGRLTGALNLVMETYLDQRLPWVWTTLRIFNGALDYEEFLTQEPALTGNS